VGAVFSLTELICVQAALSSTNKWDNQTRKLIFVKTLLVFVLGCQSLPVPQIFL